MLVMAGSPSTLIKGECSPLIPAAFTPCLAAPARNSSCVYSLPPPLFVALLRPLSPTSFAAAGALGRAVLGACSDALASCLSGQSVPGASDGRCAWPAPAALPPHPPNPSPLPGRAATKDLLLSLKRHAFKTARLLSSEQLLQAELRQDMRRLMELALDNPNQLLDVENVPALMRVLRHSQELNSTTGTPPSPPARPPQPGPGPLLAPLPPAPPAAAVAALPLRTDTHRRAVPPRAPALQATCPGSWC
jgi:hypothetical protein